MTPEEKAKELIDKFRNELSWIEIDYPVDLYRDAKQCAIMAVEEIFEFMKQDDLDSGTASNANSKWVQYYTEVLNHLKNKS